MKLKYIFIAPLLVLSTLNVTAQKKVADNAPKRVVEDASKVAVLVPATGASPCKMNTKPCAVTNKSADRDITVRVEQSFLINNELRKKIVILDKIAPNENRYIGCAGCADDGLYDKCTGYKIVLAYYEQPDSVRVRELFYGNQGKAITAR